MFRSSPFTATFSVLILLGAVLTTAAPKLMEPLLYQTGSPNALAALGHVFYGNLFMALMSAFAMWSLGRSLESDIGVSKSVVFALIVAVLTCLGAQLGATLLGMPGSVSSPWIIVGAVWLTWSVRYPNTPVRLMFMAEVQGKWLGLVGAVIAMLAFRPYQISLGAALPLGFAWAFAAGKLPFLAYGLPVKRVSAPTGPRGIKAPRADYYDEVKRRESERDEKERLRKLFESSVNEDDKR